MQLHELKWVSYKQWDIALVRPMPGQIAVFRNPNREYDILCDRPYERRWRLNELTAQCVLNHLLSEVESCDAAS